ncbi:hypothetical protein ACFY4B_07970 [Kitasatospora sp. NPDC001261]|uniref:allene oxide cyclase barrel-like domain-containing protein n=1 Tax=Kitasatospora sp. NPDC001261 TaxID=3364012 RepID=UPI0036B5B608
MGTNGSSSRYLTARRFVAAALATAAIGFAAVGTADADSLRKGRVEVLELKVQNDQYEVLDLGAAGPSLGDMDVYSGATVQGGHSVGRGGGSCQVVQLHGGEVTKQCLITMEVEGGSLTMQSLWTKGSSAPLDMAVTGGTGAYAGAHGIVRFWDIGTPDERARAEIRR